MPWPKGEVRDVLSQIENADLPYPSGPLLSSFVTGAVDPTLAARYLSARLVAEEARSVVIEWAYIVNSSKSAALASCCSAVCRRF